MNIFKKIFTEPKIPIGIFVIFLIFFGFVIWYGVVMGTQVKLSNLSNPHYLGQEVVTPNMSLKVESIRYDAVGHEPLVPKPGNKFLVAMVSLKNNSTETYDLIPLLHFYLKDKNGNVYNVAAVPSQGNQMSGSILPQDSLREELGFEVANNATDLKLYFDPGLPGNNVISVYLK